jgi:hypothetical protein
MKSFLSILLTFALSTFVVVPLANPQTYTPAELQQIAKAKNKVAKLGSGSQVKVIVRLEGGETLKGYVSSIGADGFVLETSQGPQDIPYFQVKEINKKPSTGQIVAVVGLTGAAAVGIVYGAGYLLSKCSPCIGP